MSQPIGSSMPSIGRIVHIELHPWGTIPAIVTEVTNDDGLIKATAFPPDNQPFPLYNVTHDETRTTGTWHWPEVKR
jgi:hypothetical protein